MLTVNEINVRYSNLVNKALGVSGVTGKQLEFARQLLLPAILKVYESGFEDGIKQATNDKMKEEVQELLDNN